VPCIGALIAERSAPARRGPFGELISGSHKPAAEHGLDEALPPRLLARALHVLLHAGIAGEVALDEAARDVPVDAEVGGQAVGAHAVDQAEVDHLGIASLLAAHFAERHAEDLAGGGTVDVLAGGESRQQTLVAADVGHDAQLDLRVVGRDDARARRGDERLADAPPLGGADRDVLQVRLAR
jgi:hypothetical protein